jgi:hypothetical protein
MAHADVGEVELHQAERPAWKIAALDSGFDLHGERFHNAVRRNSSKCRTTRCRNGSGAIDPISVS